MLHLGPGQLGLRSHGAAHHLQPTAEAEGHGQCRQECRDRRSHRGRDRRHHQGQKDTGSVGKSAAVGGLIGGAIGGIAKGSKKGLGRGAAAGAVTGGVLGGVKSNKKKNQNAQRQQDWENQEIARYNQGRNDYNRAFGACMTGRGYTVG
jgi:uncharacterized protein YcfJ